MIETYIGRQPIFDRENNVFGYELLYRESSENRARFDNDTAATARVMLNAFMDIGLPRLVGSKAAFVNVGWDFLLRQLPIVAGDRALVLELMPDIDADANVIAALDFHKSFGLRICLDRFQFSESRAPLLDYAHMAKLDVALSADRLKQELATLRSRRIKVVATNIEDPSEHKLCLDLGFDYFQGNFLAHPDVVTGKSLSHQAASLMHLLARLYDPDGNIVEIERLIAQDPILTFRLLGCVNSAMYSRARPVDSIRQAVTFLGLRQVATWVSIISLAQMEERPPEVLMSAMVRAKMAQLLGRQDKLVDADRMFTVGLLSLFDALMSVSMDKLIDTLPLSSEVVDALLTRGGRMGELLKAVEAHERQDWSALEAAGFGPEIVNDAWLSAIGWADEASRVASLVATPAPVPRRVAPSPKR